MRRKGTLQFMARSAACCALLLGTAASSPASAQTIRLAGYNAQTYIATALTALGETYTTDPGMWAAPDSADILIMSDDGGSDAPVDYSAHLANGRHVLMIGGSNYGPFYSWLNNYLNTAGSGWHTAGDCTSDWNTVGSHASTALLPPTYEFPNVDTSYHMVHFTASQPAGTQLYGQTCHSAPDNYVYAVREYPGGGTFSYMALDLGQYTGGTTQTDFVNPFIQGYLQYVRGLGGLDHFMFYKRKLTKGTPKFYGFEPVTLTDDSGPRNYKVVKPFRLGVPADKNGEGINDAATHLEEYKLAKATPEFTAIPNTRIVNQCNDIEVEVQKPLSLLVPTSKDLFSPVAPPDPLSHNVDHFLCYKVKAESPFPRGIQVDIADQFQTRRYDLKKITKLCNPVEKSGTPLFASGPNKGDPKAITPATIENPMDHLVCYKAKLAKKFIPQTGCGPTTPGDPGTPMPPQSPHTPVLGLYTNNQFGPERHDTIKEEEFCIPSYKNPVCGDAVVNQPSEQCDGANDDACGGLPCLGNCTCTPPSCGDNLVNQGSEQCDGTADNACPGDCLADCTCAVCGNNVAESPVEECDGTDDSVCPGLCSPGCACGQLSPVTENLTTCNPPTFDTWEFAAGAGQTIFVKADTVDAATAADLCFSVSCPSGGFGADDNVACTFPPPAFACPQASFVEATGGTCTLTMQLCSSSCTSAATANYSLKVTLNGVDTIVTLTGDDL